MIRKADTVGVFQIESRAQMSMLPRMAPKRFYDLVIEVAIVRPGPIQGDMVHPYLRRREGKEPVEFPKPELEKVLGKTLGVPLFQEQAMQVAMVAAGFSANEADQLRRAMATFKFTGGVNKFKDKLIQGMIDNGYDIEFANRTFRQLEGFGSYGFPESHAASFALIAYASSWMKCHHPDVFCAAILNAQPMGFYEPSQLVRDARSHGVEITPYRCEQIRLGLHAGTGRRKVSRRPAWPAHDTRSLGKRRQRLLSRRAARGLTRPFPNSRGARGSGQARWCGWRRRTRLPRWGFHAGEASWAIKGLRDEALPLFEAAEQRAQAIRAGADRGGSLASRYDARARGRRRLPVAWPVAAPHPLAFLRERACRPRNQPVRRAARGEGRVAHHRIRPRHGAAAARVRQGRYVHHP